MTRAFIQAPEVAAMIGLPSGFAFLMKRARLQSEHLFPLPMPHSQRPLRWKADEVQAWVQRNGNPTAAGIDPEAIASGKVVLLEMARTA